ncbi:GAF domain-containing protein [Oceanivirga miroungae]|uniref:Free methionine-R-sulfoxide reductase n=1 Tax=Oceanivirga miroungae TaxID=1130046 RepID=A0A6I8M5S9_9FUSO|nr:GAF domain-containing protein [Oceanivirga miroungae]VWL85289.1 Free methionine-R-sulfoxide reductase [Oceanivirga miroungae]
MEKELTALLEGEDYFISKLSNFSAFLNDHLQNINWVGFYIVKDDVLKLGPFQGHVACSNIKRGRGVCGTCLQEEKTIVVPNVHEFKGHIACDANSKSEIVIPIFKDNKMIALLDIDSPIYNRFTNEDKILLENLVKILEKGL